MGRKRNQGKARRAAKTKAREEAQQEEFSRLLTANERQQCTHSFKPCSECFQFVSTFSREFYLYSRRGDLSGLVAAKNATMDEFATVWDDAAKMENAISTFLCMGTQDLLESKYDDARNRATFARYFEQYVAVEVKQTQALHNWPKIEEAREADLHTLVSFFRHRIPCSCLDKIYEEVKHITKMGGCWSPNCSIPGRTLERSKTMCCSRCRNVIYCSRECQVADWSRHKPFCDKHSARITTFEANQQNM